GPTQRDRASTCRPRSARRARRSRRRRAGGRCRAGPPRRSRHSDRRRRAARASGQAREGARDPADDRADECEEQRGADDELGPAVRDPPEELAPPGSPERSDLEGQAALLDLGQRRQDDRPDQRQHSPQAGADAALRVESAGPLGARDHRRPLDHRRDGLERRQGDEREPRREPASLEVEDEAARLGRQPEQADRGRDREQPDEGLAGEVHALSRRVEGPDREQDVRSGPGEDADEHDGDRDRQRQQQRDPDEPAGDPGDERRRQDPQSDDRERAEIAPDHERAERADDGPDGLRQRVETVVRRRGGRGEVRQERRVVRAGRRYAPSSPTAASPCGNRATKRRLSAPRMANTTKYVRVLSIGSDSRPCLSTAVPRSEPAFWNAATRTSVPDPVTPPKKIAEIGAEMIALTMPQTRPATKTYAAPRSRRRASSAMSPRTAPMRSTATSQPRITKIGSGAATPSAGGAKKNSWKMFVFESV